jgi:hypothetical protein
MGAAALALFIGNAWATRDWLAPRDLDSGFTLAGSVGRPHFLAWGLRVRQSTP